MKSLIAELNDLLAKTPDFAQKTTAEQREFLSANLSKANAETFISLPEGRGTPAHTRPRPPRQRTGVAHRNRETPLRDGRTPPRQDEGRRQLRRQILCPPPLLRLRRTLRGSSNFDADYCYALGYNAACLINAGVTGYISSLRNLTKPSVQWLCRRCAHLDDVQHGAPPRRDEARDTESSRAPRRHPVPAFCRQARRLVSTPSTCSPARSSISVPPKYAISPLSHSTTSISTNNSVITITSQRPSV